MGFIHHHPARPVGQRSLEGHDLLEHAADQEASQLQLSALALDPSLPLPQRQ
jgi:hypothetical protein